MSDESQDLQARLAAAKQRQKEIASKHDQRRKLEQLQLEVQQAEQAAKDDEAIANAEVQFGTQSIAVVRTRLGAIILRCPEGMHYKRFMDLDKLSTLEVDKLARTCLVYPDPPRFDLITDAQPATINTCAKALTRLAGATEAEISGKA